MFSGVIVKAEFLQAPPYECALEILEYKGCIYNNFGLKMVIH